MRDKPGRSPLSVSLSGSLRAPIRPGSVAHPRSQLTQDTLVVGVGNTFACEHLRQRFLELARAAVSEALGRAAEVAFVLRNHPAAAEPASPTPTNPLPTPPTRRPARPRAAWTARQSAPFARPEQARRGSDQPPPSAIATGAVRACKRIASCDAAHAGCRWRLARTQSALCVRDVCGRPDESVGVCRRRAAGGRESWRKL